MAVLESRKNVDYDNDTLVHRRRDMFSVYNGDDGGGPIWVRVIMVAAKVIGYMIVPSAIAMWLVYQSSLWGPKVEAMETGTKADVAQVLKNQDEHAKKDDQIYRLLQRICSNTSKTADERSHCFD